jgi:hypothetical protein
MSKHMWNRKCLINVENLVLISSLISCVVGWICK